MDRLDDVLQLGCAEVGDLEIEPSFDLPVGLLGQADRARLGDALQQRRDIDAVAHQVAVGFLNNVADMNADAKFDSFVGRDLSVALNHRPLDFDGEANRIDDAPELDNRTVAGALNDPAVVDGDRRVDQVAPKGPEPGKDAILVRSSQPAVTDNVGDQDRRKFPGLAHCSLWQRAT